MIFKCLLDVKRWMNTYKLKMNDSKTELIIIGTQQQLSKLSFDHINIEATKICAVNEIRNLGAYFDENMSMSNHVSQKCSASWRQLYSLRRIRKYLTVESCKSLVHAFIFSQLDYCNSLLYGIPECELTKLQRIQNAAAKLIFKERKFAHVTPLLKDLHWLPVRYRVKFKIILFVFKCLSNLAPVYLSRMLTQRNNNYNTRSSCVVSFNVPSLTRKTLASRAFAYAGPVLWNSLPIALRTIATLDNFKEHLKTHLFREAFNV